MEEGEGRLWCISLSTPPPAFGSPSLVSVLLERTEGV